MTVRTIDEIFRDFVTDGVPASGPFNPHKPDIRDTLKALTEGSENFPDNRVIRLNNADEGTANNIIVTASVVIPAAAYQVLYILNVTQENTGPVTVSGAINRELVTNINQPVPAGYLTPGMAVLCIDTGSELRMLSYGDMETLLNDVEVALAAAQAAQAGAEVARDEAVAAASDAVSQGNVPIYSTRNAVEGLEIPNGMSAIRTNGFGMVGDGGAALYKRVFSEPTHAGKVQSADGAWWELAELEINARQLGAKGDGVSDDTTALQNFLDCTVALKVNGKIPSGRWNISAPGLLLDHSSVAGDFTPSIYGEGPLTLFVCAAGNYTAFETRGYNAPGSGAKLQTVGGFTLYKPAGLDGIGFKSTGFCFGRYERIRTIGFNIGQSYEGAFSCEIEQPYSYSNNVGMDFIPGTGDTSDPGGGVYCPNAITITQPYISTNNVQGLHVLRPANFAVRGGSIENNGVQGTNSAGLWAENPGYQGRQGIILDGVYFEDNAGKADVLITSYEGPSANTIKDCNFARISSTAYTTNNILTDVTVDLLLRMEGNGFGSAGDYVPDESRPYVAFTSQAPIYRGFDTNLIVQDVGTRYLKRPQFTATGNAADVTINTDQQILAFPALSSSSPDYVSASNRFVAPFDGLYQFTATLGLNSVTTGGSIGFAKNGTLLTEAIVRFTGVQPVSITRAISLAEGDYVDVRALMDAGWSFDYRGFISSFSGYLVG